MNWFTILGSRHEGSVREKIGIGDEWPVCCNFSIVTRWIDQLFNQNPTVCCNFPSFPPGEGEKVGHAGSKEGRKENCSKRWDFDWTADQSSVSWNCSKRRNRHRCYFFPWLTPREWHHPIAIKLCKNHSIFLFHLGQWDSWVSTQSVLASSTRPPHTLHLSTMLCPPDLTCPLHC